MASEHQEALEHSICGLFCQRRPEEIVDPFNSWDRDDSKVIKEDLSERISAESAII